MAKGDYVRIKSAYLLRGWQNLPYALVKRTNGTVIPLSLSAFRAIRFCNGGFEAGSPVFLGARKGYLRELDEHGIIEYLDAPGDLLPDQEFRCYGNRYLKRVLWSLTGRCNYRCVIAI